MDIKQFERLKRHDVVVVAGDGFGVIVRDYRCIHPDSSIKCHVLVQFDDGSTIELIEGEAEKINLL